MINHDEEIIGIIPTSTKIHAVFENGSSKPIECWALVRNTIPGGIATEIVGMVASDDCVLNRCDQYQDFSNYAHDYTKGGVNA
jgi:hypothetical protein